MIICQKERAFALGRHPVAAFTRRSVERFHRVDAKTLKVDITLTDATAYTKPMTTTVTYKTLEDPLWEPKEFICSPETNYHPDVYVH